MIFLKFIIVLKLCYNIQNITIMDISEDLICALRCTLKSLLETINNEILHWHYGFC